MPCNFASLDLLAPSSIDSTINNRFAVLSESSTRLVKIPARYSLT